MKPIVGTVGAILILIIIFGVAVAWFRASKKTPEEMVFVESIADVLTPESVSLNAIEEGVDTKSRDAILYSNTDGAEVGSAKRGAKDGAFYHSAKATLPEIDREAFFYEGWLVRKVPFDFFSTGEMVTNDDGEFVLEWEGEEDEDYSGYTQVVLTIEPYDGNPDPGDHVAEGEFGNE